MEISSPFWWALFILIIVCKERDGSFTYVWACYCLLPQLTSLLHECIFFLPLLGAFWPGNWSYLSRYIALHWSGHRRGSRTLCGQMCNIWAQLLFNEKIKHEQNITMVWADFFFFFIYCYMQFLDAMNQECFDLCDVFSSGICWLLFLDFSSIDQSLICLSHCLT